MRKLSTIAEIPREEAMKIYKGLDIYSREREGFESSFKSGLKNGFLGSLINESQYKEMKSSYARKVDIVIGQEKAWKEALSKDDSLIWQNGFLKEQTLTNISSIACREFLFIKARNFTVRRLLRIKRQKIRR
jgi:hypothetical protein